VRILTTAPAPDAGPVRPAGFGVLRDAAAVRSVIGLPRRFAAIGSLASGLVDEARPVLVPVRTKRTDHDRATAKSGDISESSDRR
jgi:hypothetical protein